MPPPVPRTKTDQLQSILLWAIPPLLGLLVYWPGLTAWFQKDDFAWLGLRHLVGSWRDLGWALFAPMAQGTIRPLSERAYYMGLSGLFGIHPLPFRLLAFLTFAGATVVLGAVTGRLTRSPLAGFWAAVFWTVNNALAIPVSSASGFHELLCSFTMLLSFWCLILYQETGARKFYLAQVGFFVLGFLVLEMNVVYPALAAVYLVFRKPRLLPTTLPLFALSAVYTLAHSAAAPMKTAGPYKMYWDGSVFSTLWIYWKMALGPNRLSLLGIPASGSRSAMTILLTVALIVFLLRKMWQRQWIVLVFPAWFVIVLAPLLPLREHISDYYLTIPLLGLAMWGGWALVEGWRAAVPLRAVAVSCLLVYLGVAIPVARATAVSLHNQGADIRRLVLGIVDLSRGHSDKILLLTGVTSEMFDSALYHRPLRLFGLNEVYLAREDRPRIASENPMVDVRPFFLDEPVEKTTLQEGRLVIYDVSGWQPRDITFQYKTRTAR